MDWCSVFWGFVVGGLIAYCFGTVCGYYRAKSEIVSDTLSSFRDQMGTNEFFSLHISATRENGGDDDNDSDDEPQPTDPSLSLRDWN